MARKKEADLEERNQKRIAETAKKIFLEKGYEKAQMGDIAKQVGMSKSTLYIYFKSKEEIRNYISLEAMNYFLEQLMTRVQKETMSQHDRCMEICWILVEFKEKYPLSFQLIVEKIDVEEELLKKDEVLAGIYETGEEVNRFIYSCFLEKDQKCDERELFLTVMALWGSIYGMITLADQKEDYLMKNAGITKQEFLERSFERMYQNMPEGKERV